jgi:hypothetical protein
MRKGPGFLSKWSKTLLEASLKGSLERLLISSRSVKKHHRYMQFLFLVGRLIKIISSETAWENIVKYYRKHLCLSYYFKFQTIRNQNYPWWPCLLSNRKEMMKSYRGSSIDASCNISLYFPKLFQRRWFLSIDVVCSSSIYGFSLPLRYLQALLVQMNQSFVGSIYERFARTIARNDEIL